jgi:homoaconitase/3-isopropylmalate dehydratase large subunit
MVPRNLTHRWRGARGDHARQVVGEAGCGACIGCGLGVSEIGDQVTVSAINRNYKGRSGPGKLWLASPLTVAASAFTGTITAYTPGMFAKEKELAGV